MILNLIWLLLATFCIGFFVLGTVRGSKYDGLVQNLDGEIYPLSSIYAIGFYLGHLKIFKLRGKMESILKKQALLLWEEVYCEYYANLAWAQFLSLSLLCLSVIFLFGCLAGGGILTIIIAGLGIAGIWNFSLSRMKEELENRRNQCLLEFPDMVSKLSLLINSGMVLREAWYLIAKNKEGALYDLMKKSCEFMDNGDSDVEGIYKLGVLSDSPEIKKFTGAMTQGIEKGNSELAEFLLAQSRELWEHRKQASLQNGEKAAGKLIIPLAIMFGGIIMIIVSAAMQSMAF